MPHQRASPLDLVIFTYVTNQKKFYLTHRIFSNVFQENFRMLHEQYTMRQITTKTFETKLLQTLHCYPPNILPCRVMIRQSDEKMIEDLIAKHSRIELTQMCANSTTLNTKLIWYLIVMKYNKCIGLIFKYIMDVIAWRCASSSKLSDKPSDIQWKHHVCEFYKYLAKYEYANVQNGCPLFSRMDDNQENVKVSQ